MPLFVTVLVFSGCQLVGNTTQPDSNNLPPNISAQEELAEPTNEYQTEENSTTTAYTFDLGGDNFFYMMDGEKNPTIKVKEGDTVTINFTSENGFHDWVVDQFGKTKAVSAGNSASVTFVANKAGTYEYYCSIGSHRENGMKGMFIVE